MPAKVSVIGLVMTGLLIVLGAVLFVSWASRQYIETFGPTLLTQDSDGNVWVHLHPNLYLLDRAGKSVRTLRLEHTRVILPLTALAPMPNGTLLVGSEETGLVRQIAVDGTLLTVIDPVRSGTFRLFGTFHLAYDAGYDELWIVDTSNHRVLVLSRDGQVLRQLGNVEKQRGPFRFPNGLLLTIDGQVYVVDTNHHAITILNRQLTPQQTLWVEPRLDSNARWPVELGRDSAGNLYVSVLDNRMVHGEVHKLDSTGQRLCVFALPAEAAPKALLVRSDDRLIADQHRVVIERFDLACQRLGVFGDAAFQQILVQTQRWRTISWLSMRGGQTVLGLLLVGLLVSYAISTMRQRRQRTLQPATLLLTAPALPGGTVRGTTIGLHKGYFTVLASCVLIFPYLPYFIALRILYRSCALTLNRQALVVFGETLLILRGITFLAYLLLYAHVRRGFFQRLFWMESAQMLQRHQGLIATHLQLGEAIVQHMLGTAGSLIKLVVLTDRQLMLLTLTRWGRVLHGPYAIALSALQAARLQPACIWWPWLLGRLPRGQVEFVVSPSSPPIKVRVVDVTTAASVIALNLARRKDGCVGEMTPLVRVVRILLCLVFRAHGGWRDTALSA